MKNRDKNKSVAFIILVSIFKYHNIFGIMENIKKYHGTAIVQ